MAHLVAYRNRTNISGQHSNERISVHRGRHPNVRIFGSFAGSSTVDSSLRSTAPVGHEMDIVNDRQASKLQLTD